MKVCPNCGQEYEGKFCPNCGALAPYDAICPNCGVKIAGASRFCPNCGRPLGEPVNYDDGGSPSASPYSPQENRSGTRANDYAPGTGYAAYNGAPPETIKRTNTYSVTGFVLGFIIPVLGLILCIMALAKAKYYGGNGKPLAIAGIILSAILTAVYAFWLFNIFLP